MGVHAKAVQQLYIAYFSRPADVGGLIYWENIVNTKNGDTSLISAEFAKSAEYIASFADLSNADIVKQVYLNLFGRPAEAEGVTYWADLLDRQLITIDNVVTQVAMGAQGTDLAAYNAKVSGALVFTANFSPSDAPFYSGAGPSQVAKNFITSIINADTLALATQPGNLQNTFAKLVSSSFTPQTLTLTTGLDNIAPTTEVPFGGDDIFNANSIDAGQTLNVGDVLNGGLGVNTLNLNSTTQTALRLDGGINLNNIQNANITSDNGATIFSQGWVGLKQLNVNSVGTTQVQAPASADATLTTTTGLGSITVNGGNKLTINSSNSAGTGSITIGDSIAATGDIHINNSSSLNGNPVNVKGGANIYIKQTYTNPDNVVRIVNGAAQTITGSNATQIVDINNQGTYHSSGVSGLTYIQNSVTVTDANFASNTSLGSINTVAISGFSNATIQSSALSTLNLFDGTGNVKINPGMLTTAPTDKTLDLGLVSFNGSLDLSNTYSRVNITTGAESGSNVFINSLQDTALSTLSVGGKGSVVLSDLTGNTALNTLNYTGSGSITTNLTATTVTHIDTQGALGSANFTIDGTKTSYVGGAGIDELKLNANAASQSIHLGGGNDSLDITASGIPTVTADGGDGVDSIITTLSQLDTIINNPVPIFTSFEGINLTDAVTGQTLDAARLGAIQNVVLNQAGSYTVKNLANGSHISLPHGGTTYAFSEIPHAPGKFNSVSLTLNNTSNNITDFATGGITLGNIEKASININYTGTPANFIYDTVSLKAADLISLSLSGNRGVNLINTDENLSFVDARGITAGGLTFTGGTELAFVYGSDAENAVNVLDLSASTNRLEYTGGDGSDILQVSGQANRIRVGTGSDSVLINQASQSLETINTILDPHAGLTVGFADRGEELFLSTRVTLPKGTPETLQNYADAAIDQANSNGVDGVFAWFQFGGSTFLIQSRHSGSDQFISGTDGAVRLVGLFDLSKAIFSGGSFITLA
jgi:S-layer protein